MQLYHGLPTITNKICAAEQRGVPHHLLGHINVLEQPWDADKFKQEASSVIEEIRNRGNLPIVVGGTHYYVDSLLFDGIRLENVQNEATESLPILDASTVEIHDELKRVDPVMAERWHPNDRRKIQRSLEIYLRTGRKASDLYAEQRAGKDRMLQEASDAGPWEKLLFWVYTEKTVLSPRLDDRVDKMLADGLLQEVRELFNVETQMISDGQPLELTKGIWQSIGYKQFKPYIAALNSPSEHSDAALSVLQHAAIEDTKTATRRYASSQMRWIRLKHLPLLKERGPEAMDSLYLLDSTDKPQYQANVIDPAARLTKQFLECLPKAKPVDISDTAKRVLFMAEQSPGGEVLRKRTCEICGTVTTTEQMWERHVKGSSHRRAAKRKRKLSLVVVETLGDTTTRSESPDGEDSFSCQIGDVFGVET